MQSGTTRLRVRTHAGSRMMGIAALVVCAISGVWGSAFAAAPATPASGAAPGLAPESQGFRQATERERDAETLQSLTAEGRLLLSRDRVTLPAYDYCSMAVSAAERGDFRDSVEAAARALVMAQRTDNADLVALSKRDLAIAYSYAGDLDDAEKYAQEALASTPKAPEQVFAPANKVLGDIALRRGHPQDAIDAYNRALETASPRYRPLVLLSITNAQIAAGDTAGARKTFDAASPAPSADLAPEYRRIEGNLLLAEGKPQDALLAFTTLLSESGGSDANYDRLWAHEGIGRADLALGQRARAREAYLQAVDDSEKIRARFRSEEFKTGLFGDTQSVFEMAITLTVEVGDYASAWSLSERSRARALLDVVRNRVDAGVNDRQLNGDVPGLDVVRNGLKPNETLVEYHNLEKSIIVWVIRNEGLKGYTLPIARADMDAAVTDFRNAIVRRRATAITYGDKLYALLIAPLGLRADDRLIIVPHGALHYLPFQALHGPDGFLIQRHAIALEPSASVAVQLATRERQVASNLVAFGNPTIAPAYALPGAEAEVRGIAPLFARQEVFLQSSATRVSFRDNAPTGRVLHVATHAEADTIDPLHSRILLAPATQPADGPDSLLAKDIYNLKLNNVSLVTLSACETGLGRIARGDEILGFTRAFFYAGATSLIVSMWPVADESSALTMRTFYSQLADGHEAIDAMRTAQLAVMQNSQFAHPFFWAPFDLMGGWRLSIAR
ncbi:CHAT domain-containing protein [Paraburkholderia hospita]|uniref:CHAT domain-containing protein n=2 Tax=Paraburkholderia hospita TaxID=169430 RepID=A0AAN1MQE5_9BURK|nr:CHAT domain-containing protein [Paraburkholderia hospita]AUT75311.1 CHAT domain-containing protein [Paraburkholderia hospita]SEH58736.1 CHAT domain-containing protein [Paraburkholderia hospita]